MKGLLAFLNRWEDEFVNVGVGLMPISWVLRGYGHWHQGNDVGDETFESLCVW